MKPQFDSNFMRHLSAVSRRARGGVWFIGPSVPIGDTEMFPITTDSGELVAYVYGRRNAELVTEYRNVMPHLLKTLRGAQRAAGINASRWGRATAIALREGLRIDRNEVMARTPIFTREQAIAIFGDKRAGAQGADVSPTNADICPLPEVCADDERCRGECW